MATLSIRNLTRTAIPKLPYERMKEYALSKRYSLSLVFIGDKRSQKLNKTHKHKDAPASVLAFPLAPESGEIFLNFTRARKRARMLRTSPTQATAYLFIHALLHLNGHTHGGTMDRAEKTMCKRFDIPYPQ